MSRRLVTAALQFHPSASRVGNVFSRIKKGNFDEGKKKESITGLRPPSPKDSIHELLVSNFADEDFLKEVQSRSLENLKKIEVPDESKSFAGKLVCADGKAIKAASDELKKSAIIVTPGLGGGLSLSRILSRAREAKILFPKDSCAIYVPVSEFRIAENSDSSEERYLKGLQPYLNCNFIDEEGSREFFEEVIKPRFFDDCGNILPPQDCKRLLMVSHSMAVREGGSHIRYFAKHLKEIRIDDEIIAQYVGKILRLNIASPLVQGDESNLSPSINIVSLDDSGSKKPEEFFVKIYLNPFFQSRNISQVEVGGLATLFVLGFGVVADDEGIKDGFCHSMLSHVEAIVSDEKLSAVIDVCHKFNDPKFSDEEVAKEVSSLCEAAEFFPEFDYSNNKIIKHSLENLSDKWCDIWLSRWSSQRSLSKNSSAICEPSPSPQDPLILSQANQNQNNQHE